MAGKGAIWLPRFPFPNHLVSTTTSNMCTKFSETPQESIGSIGILEGVSGSVRIPYPQKRVSRLTTCVTSIDHAPVPNNLEGIHNLIELLGLLFGESNVQGSDVFAETGDPGSVGTPRTIQDTYYFSFLVPLRAMKSWPCAMTQARQS